MTADRLRKLLRAVPFVPFDISLANGKIVHLPHPDFAALDPKGRILLAWYPDGVDFEIIDVALITNLSVKVPASAAA